MVILLFLVVSLVICTYKKSCYGFIVYMVIRMCIPSSARFFGFSFNTLSFALFFLLSYKTIIQAIKERANNSYIFTKNIYKWIVTIGILGSVSLVTGEVPFDYQLSSLIKFVYTEVLPAVVVLYVFKYESDFRTLLNVIAGCAIFSCVYAVFTFLTRTNPLHEMFYTGDEIYRDAADISRRGMFEGTAVGIYNDKVYMSIVAYLYFSFFWGKQILHKFLLYTLLLTALVATFLTSQRSAILGLMVFLFVQVYRDKRNRSMIFSFAALVGVVLYFASISFEQFGQLQQVINSTLFFWDDKYQSDIGVGGSTMELRITQFLGVFDALKYSLLQGLGYNFPGYFHEFVWDQEVLGQNPVFAGFESCIFVIGSSSGLIGIYAWAHMYYKNYKLTVSNCVDDMRFYYASFYLIFLMVVILTDASGAYFQFFMFMALNILYVKWYHNKGNVIAR